MITICKRTASDYTTMPWKNGNGSTTQLAIFPENAALDDFAWRISSAVVGSSSDFSHFPDVDRSLVIISGAGLRLINQSEGTILSLTPKDPPYAFKGEHDVSAQLMATDPVIDFNVMTHRSTHQHTLKKIAIEGEITLTVAPNETLAIYHAGGETAYFEGRNLDFITGDLCLLDVHSSEQPQQFSIISHNALLYVTCINANGNIL